MGSYNLSSSYEFVRGSFGANGTFVDNTSEAKFFSFYGTKYLSVIGGGYWLTTGDSGNNKHIVYNFILINKKSKTNT